LTGIIHLLDFFDPDYLGATDIPGPQVIDEVGHFDHIDDFIGRHLLAGQGVKREAISNEANQFLGIPERQFSGVQGRNKLG